MQTRISIDTLEDLAQAHEVATGLAVRCGFGEIATERLARAAVAAGSGMLDHAGGGVLHLRPLQEEVTGAAAPQVEIVAVDRPARPDRPERADPSPRAPSRHAGARAGGRLAALYELVTALDRYDGPTGSVIRMTLSPADRPAPLSLPAVAVGVVWTPAAGDMAPGGLNIHSARGQSTVVLGLGRGAEAARRVAALQGFGAQMQQIERARATLPGGGDMALAAAHIEARSGHVRVAGAGRFRACVIDAASAADGKAEGKAEGKRASEAANPAITPLLRPPEAIIDGGARVRGPLAQAQADWPPQALLVLHDDGLSWPWALDAYPGLLAHHPAIVAAVLHRDFSRQPGRGCVLVCRRSDECMPSGPARDSMPYAAGAAARPAVDARTASAPRRRNAAGPGRPTA